MTAPRPGQRWRPRGALPNMLPRIVLAVGEADRVGFDTPQPYVIWTRSSRVAEVHATCWTDDDLGTRCWLTQWQQWAEANEAEKIT